MSYEDEFDYMREQRRYRRPSPPHRYTSDTRRSQQFLDPAMMGGGLTRTRSQGARPNPIIINNEFIQDNYSNVPPAGYMPYPAAYPPSPDMRGRGRLGDELADEFVNLELENRRLRSRSRGRSDAAWADRRDDYYESELRRKERQLADLERKASLEDERERMKHEMELQRLKDDNERREREQREKDERRRILDEYDLEQREKEEKKKEDERRMREKIKQEELDKKAKEEKEWDEFVRKYHEKETKEKEEKKKKAEELDEAIRRRLLDAGYSKAYADRIVEEDKTKTTITTFQSSSALVPAMGVGRPTFVKVHKDYLSVDTLRYYNLPWEYDKKDKNYIVILREISKSETDVLFEHTRSLRQGKLLLEPAKKESNYAWVRKRDRSSSKVKKLSIVKFDDE